MCSGFLLGFADTQPTLYVNYTVGCIFCQIFLKKCFQRWSVPILGFGEDSVSMPPMSSINTHNCKNSYEKKSTLFFVYLKFYRNWGFLSSIFFQQGAKNAYFGAFRVELILIIA